MELTGDDYDELLAASEEVLLYLRGKDYAGVEELKIDVDKRKPQMPVTIDREKARTYGLSTRDIGYTLRTALFGREVGTFKDGEDDYPINLRFSEEHRHSSDALMNQKVIFRSQSDGQIKEVPISAVATASRATTFSAVKRKDLKRVITITSNVLEGANPTEIISNMEVDMAEELNLPTTVKWAFTGQQEEQAKEMAFLSKALLIALFLIFLIIVSQFNSVTTPFIIGFSVVFSLIGVLLGLVIFQMEFVIIMTMIGIISLAGVVVNNAIVLIDYTNLLRARRREELGLEEGESTEAATRLPFRRGAQGDRGRGQDPSAPRLVDRHHHGAGPASFGHWTQHRLCGTDHRVRPQHLRGRGQQRVLEAHELGDHLRVDLRHVLDPHHRAGHVLVDRAHHVQVGGPSGLTT